MDDGSTNNNGGYFQDKVRLYLSINVCRRETLEFLFGMKNLDRLFNEKSKRECLAHLLTYYVRMLMIKQQQLY